MNARQEPVHGRASLTRLIEPASIAVVGASPNPQSFANRTVAGLEGFSGSIYLVNAKYNEIDGHRCYPSISALPQVPDCVVIATARVTVEPILSECAAFGAGGVILYASGYAETGKAEDIAAQARLTAIAQSSGLRLLGPNCIGLVNTQAGNSITFMGKLAMPQPQGPAIGIVSQSGAIGLGLGQGARMGTQISHVLNAGNSCDVDVADLVDYLIEDDGCSAIACVFEGMAQPHRFAEAARRAWEADKPLVVCKLATSELGAAAAMSHTGSLAGADATYRAALARYGVVMVDHLEELVETASFFAKAGRPSASGVAVVAASGGMAIMAADAAETHGVPLPPPDAQVAAVLAKHVPDFGSTANPCDVTAQVATNPASLEACAEAFIANPAYGAFVLPVHYAYGATTDRVALAEELGRQHGKPVCIVWTNGWLDGPGAAEAERSPHTTLFRSMNRCFATLAAWHRREAFRSVGARVPDRVSPTAALQVAAAEIDATPHAVLTEREAKRVLAAYGVPVVGESLVQTSDEAVGAAARLGYPVAMKAESPDIAHKTEAGVVRLNLRDEAQVREAFEVILANVANVAPLPRLHGVLVQPMVPAGVEMVVGARIDPQFGPLVLVGMGGVLVELLKDTALELAPVTRAEALAMLCRLKGYRALAGFRGAQPVDLELLADVICRISEFAADQRERFEELDVNPLICDGSNIVAVDALIARKVAA